jgi:predicted ArsR family transcriptional regulator
MSKSDWVSSGVVCSKLGIRFKHLTRLREEGLFKPKTHWINIARPRAVRPTYRYHLTRCQKALESSVDGMK